MTNENLTNPQYQQVLATAQQLCGPQTDWVTFFREVLGVDGVVRRAFPNLEDLAEFEKSEEYATIQKILVKLREKKGANEAETEPTRVITVRLPKSMHEYLRTEAHDMHTSMNKLCISKLLQVVEQDMIPAEKTSPARRRASSPAPQAPQSTMMSTASNGMGNGDRLPSNESLAPRYNTPSVTPPLKTGF